MIVLKSAREIEIMRRAGIVVGETIYVLCKSARTGITTGELSDLAERTIKKFGAESAFLGYIPPGYKKGFPGVVCISINEEVVHGIPGERKLLDGDVVSFDVGVKLDGMCADGAGTVIVGKGTPDTIRLLETTKRCLYNGIAQALVGNRISDISSAVQETAEREGFGVIRALVGHGVGTTVHEPPQVPNFVAVGVSPKLKKGTTIAIEPMISLGSWQVVELADGWTIVTQDGSPSAHFEHTIAVAENGPKILTLRENGKEGFCLEEDF